jgi:class 3 adenylate cyclase
MKFRVAVHYGAITVDSALSPGEDSLIGANVNFVFRMEKIASGLQQYCVLSEEAAGHLGQFGAVMPLGEHSLSGFSGTHALYSY